MFPHSTESTSTNLFHSIKRVTYAIGRFVYETPFPLIIVAVSAVASALFPAMLTLPFLISGGALLAGRLVIKLLNHYNPTGNKQFKQKIYRFFESHPYLLTALFFASLGLSVIYLPVGLTLGGCVGVAKGFIVELDLIKSKQDTFDESENTVSLNLINIVKG